MSYYFENQNPAVMANGFNTQKDTSIPGYSVVASTGAVTIAGATTGGLSIGRTAASVVFGGTVNTAVATQSFTATAAQCLGGLITHTSVTGAGTFTVPTGAQLTAGISGSTTGDNFWLVYANVGSQTVTITAATGTTLTGTVAVPTGKNAQIFFVCTAANTWIANCTLSA